MKNALFRGCAQVLYQRLWLLRAACRPTEEELANFGRPDFTIYNAGRGKTCSAVHCLGRRTGFSRSSPSQSRNCKHSLYQSSPAARPDAPSMRCRLSCRPSVHPSGAFPANRFTSYMTSETSVDVCCSKREVVSEHSTALQVSFGNKASCMHGVPASPPPKAAHAIAHPCFNEAIFMTPRCSPNHAPLLPVPAPGHPGLSVCRLHEAGALHAAQLAPAPPQHAAPQLWLLRGARR